MPIQTDFEKKQPGANLDKKCFSLGFNEYLPTTNHDATRNRRKRQEKETGQGLEMHLHLETIFTIK